MTYIKVQEIVKEMEKQEEETQVEIGIKGNGKKKVEIMVWKDNKR